jgi:hypothetical protein
MRSLLWNFKRVAASATLMSALIGCPATAQKHSDFPMVGSGRIERPTDEADTAFTRIQATLGHGFNDFTGQVRGNCIDYRLVPPTAFTGYGSKTEIKLIQSAEDFKKEVSVSVSGSTGFGAVSVEASAKYDNSVAIKASSDYLLVRVRVEGASVVADSASISTEAQKYSASKEKFFALCGNRYVSEVQLGGDFIAVLEFTANSETERTTLEASLKVATAASSLGAEFKTAIESARTKSSMHATVVRHGSAEKLPEFSLDKLIDYARDFPTKIDAKSAVPIGISLSDFQSVDPGIETQEVPPVIHRLHERLSDARGALDRIGPLLEQHNRLGLSARLGDLQNIQDTLPDKMQDVQDALTACGRAPWMPGRCDFSKEILAFNVPKLPGRPIATDFTSKTGDAQRIGIVGPGEQRFMLIRGTFDYCSCGKMAEAAGQTTVVFEGPDGTTTSYPYRPPMKFTGPGTVYVRLWDSKYDDNIDYGIQGILY